LSVSALFASPAVPVSEELTPKSCTIRIKGDYGGTPIDVYVTVEAENCAEAAGTLLKTYTAKK
jgi:hypothetical protein